MLQTRRLLAILGFLTAIPAGEALASDVEGIWALKSGKITVKVSDCGEGLCAVIVGMKEPEVNGKPKVDKENPDPALRKRPIMGLSILSGMRPSGDGEWTGYLYNPDDGNTYSATLRLRGEVIKVKGCVAGVLCKSKTFVRVN